MLAVTNPYDDDHMHEECGVFGIFNAANAAAHTALGLHALQHRGQEAAGIVSFDGKQFYSHRALGLISDNFGDGPTIEKLKGHMAIGHTRYSTTGETLLRNVQPLFAEFNFGGLAIAHNGNLTNAGTLKRELVSKGCIFQSTTDTETVIHLIATAREPRAMVPPATASPGVVLRIIEALKQLVGTYSFVMLTQDFMLGARDPYGVRPLVLGQLDG